jgi:hypothetical protein
MQIQGPSAEDYPPFYKRFLQNPLGPHYFNWLPAHIFSQNDICALQLLERPRDFFRHLNDYVPKFCKPWNKKLGISNTIPNIFQEQKEGLMQKAIIALRLRAAFRRLVHVWIWRKAARIPLPENDSITFAPFSRPVVITDMKARRRYAFEAAPLIAHIESQLNYVSYGFVQSMHPRNPITNLPFSSGQLIEIYKQCVQYRKINDALVSFAACKFNVERYYTIYKHAIAFHYNLRSVMQVENDTGHEILLAFIEDTAELLVDELSDSDIDALTYGLVHFPAHSYFKRWRRVFVGKQFCDEESFEDRILFDSLMVRAKELLDIRHVVLNVFRRAKLKVNDE